MRKALIVEDFEIIAEMWKSLLLEDGFTAVYVTHNAENVENYINNNTPEIILMDVNLPLAKNGIELTKWLIENNNELNIIILTIHNEPYIIKRAFEAGAKGFVTKSSGLKEIKIAIKRILNGDIYLCQESSQFSYLFKELATI
jgi:DNA-binding NarL/FixJ family response regulator